MAKPRLRNGRWQIQVRLKGKRPISGTFDTEAKAKAWEKEQKAKLRANVVVTTPKDTRTTLKDVILRVKYAPTYSTATNHFLSDPISDLAIVSITKQDVYAWKTRNQHISPGSLAKYVNVPRMAWQYALEVLELPMRPVNPFTRVGLSKGQQRRERRLAQFEYEKLIQGCIQPKLYSGKLIPGSCLQEIIDWAIETGMRRAEITNVRYSHFRDDYKYVLIPDTKTNTPRTIPLSLRAQEIAKRRIHKAAVSSGRLFPFRPETVTSCFHRLVASCRIDNLHFHDLRHEALSRLNDKGLSPYEIMIVSGHKTTEQLKIYIQTDRERVYDKINRSLEAA